MNRVRDRGRDDKCFSKYIIINKSIPLLGFVSRKIIVVQFVSKALGSKQVIS